MFRARTSSGTRSGFTKRSVMSADRCFLSYGHVVSAWPVRTDVTTGDAARYKRCVVIEHGE